MVPLAPRVLGRLGHEKGQGKDSPPESQRSKPGQPSGTLDSNFQRESLGPGEFEQDEEKAGRKVSSKSSWIFLFFFFFLISGLQSIMTQEREVSRELLVMD